MKNINECRTKGQISLLDEIIDNFAGVAYDSKRPDVSPYYVLIMLAISCSILAVAIIAIARGED